MHHESDLPHTFLFSELRRWIVRFGVTAGLGVLSLSAQPQAGPAGLVNRYCAGCHNQKLRTAGLVLERVAAEPGKDPAVWEKILRKVRAGEMPPAGLPRPDATTLAEFQKQVESSLDAAAAADPNPGRPTIHRLNRAEYRNSIRDLLSLDINAADTLPGDDSGYGFDNIADVLSLSPALLERYIAIAHKVSRLAVGDTDIKPAEVKIPSGIEQGVANPKQPPLERISEDLPFGSRNGISVSQFFPVDAEYEIRFEVTNVPPRGEGVKQPEIRVPIKAGLHTLQVAFLRESTKQEFAAPVTGRALAALGRGPIAAGAPPKLMDFRMDGARVKRFELAPGALPPQLANLIVNGPFNISGSGNSSSRQKIFVCTPHNVADEEPCARTILTVLARNAYRRPVSADDVSPLMGFYQRGRGEGDFNKGIEDAIEAMLVSPSFLFRVERDSGSQNVHPVSDTELASRLSFFLWSSIPDEHLLKLAEENQLRHPGVIEAEIARMLHDPRSDALVSNFTGQWLYLRNLTRVRPDPDAFPEFDDALRSSMRTETELFFADILRNHRSLLDLLDGDFTYLNERMARHYGIPGIYGSQFRRVQLDASKRRGILGQASILTVTSYPNRTSVVQRGKWVLENLLGTPPPPPPPDVPELKPHGSDGRMTLRQAMETHRANPTCASCHARMDPIGFALENYDGVGHWRDKEESGAPLDTSGKFPDGTAFSGPSGLVDTLLDKNRDRFIQTLTEKLLTYALGRGLEYYDQPAVRSIIRQAKEQNYALDALLAAVVKSPTFQMRRTAEP